MKIFLCINFCFVLFCYGDLKLEQIPRLNTSTALQILNDCHWESLNQGVEVAIVVVGIDGRILASCKSEKMDPGLYDFAKFKGCTLKSLRADDLYLSLSFITKEPV